MARPRALDLANGVEIWKDSYAAPYTMHPAATMHGKGPRATPVISGRTVYTDDLSAWVLQTSPTDVIAVADARAESSS